MDRSTPSRNPPSPASFPPQGGVPFSSEPTSDDANALQTHPTRTRNSPPEAVANFKRNTDHLDSDVSEISLQSTLDELIHLRIPPSRLTIMDSSEVGSGRYGEVLLAILDASSQTPTWVAAKELRTVGTRGVRKRVALRLARELKIWARANHPHVLQLVGYYLSDNYEIAQLISPFMTNGNVSQYLEKQHVGVLKRMDIIRDITLGMNYLHSGSPPICHGDLKPTNILMNDSLQAVLCDFGLASFVEESGISTGLTTSRSIKGSIRYMSPELHLEEDAKHTLESDIWAWGCTAFEVVTDYAPYQGVKGDSGIIMAFIRGDPPGSTETLMRRLIDEASADVPPAFQTLPYFLTRCWSFEAEQRPQMPGILRRTFPEIVTEQTRIEENVFAKSPSRLQRSSPLPASPTLRFQNAVRKVMHLQRLKRPLPQVFETQEISRPPPQDSSQDPPPPPRMLTPKMRFKDAVRKVAYLERMRPPPWRFVQPTRLAELIPKLKALKPIQELYEHRGLVRHLQFSPDGQWLATCSWDRKAIIWKVGANLSLHRVLVHPGPGFLSQVAWSPNGEYLLTRTFRHVKVWVAETGVLKHAIACESKIEAVTWMPSGDSFACVEGSVVHIMDLEGKIKDDHPFERLDIRGVAPTHDEQRMILVATLQSSKGDLETSKSKAEKRIIVYHLGNKKVECQVPVLENVRDVTISSDRNNGDLALISYEDTAPPELWRISVVHIGDPQEAMLHLLKTYMSTTVVEFAGPSYLGGTQDQFVICAGKKGDIDIWDRETGLLLHSLQGANIVHNTPEDLTGVAWNHRATGKFMFASATNDGTVRIWTAETPSDIGSSLMSYS